jgi:fructose-1-phosphate kinase PfkB-like protein
VVIVAAGLSPAWQQILVFDEFVSGEVNRAREAHWCGSGKVLNTGLAISQLGAECCTLSPLGGAAREAIEAEFRSLGAPLRTITCREATRVCTTILDRATGATTELVENARPLSEDEVAAYIAAFAEEAAQAKVVVLTGSLPAGVPSSFYRARSGIDRGACAPPPGGETEPRGTWQNGWLRIARRNRSAVRDAPVE